MSLIDTNRWAWQRISRLVQTRDGYLCQLRISPRCKVYSEVTDHKVPRSLGGTDDLDNLQAACGPCNRLKGMGLFLGTGTSRDASPAKIPPPRQILGDYGPDGS